MKTKGENDKQKNHTEHHASSLANHRMILLLALVIAIILFGFMGYYIVYSEEVGNRTGIVGDALCSNFASAIDQDACCAQGHEGEATIECVGHWDYRPDTQRCSYVCGLPDYDDELYAEENCQLQGGTWRELPNSCVDSCDVARNPQAISCLQALTFGCDCGTDQCWNGNTCEGN